MTAPKSWQSGGVIVEADGYGDENSPYWRVRIDRPGSGTAARPLLKDLFPDPEALARFIDEQWSAPRYSVKFLAADTRHFGIVDIEGDGGVCATFLTREAAEEYVEFLLARSQEGVGE